MNNQLREKLISMLDTELKANKTLAKGRYDGYPEALKALHIQHA